MAIAHHAGATPASPDIEIRSLGLDDLRVALAQGWQDFLNKRGDILFLGFIYPGVALLAALVASNTSVLPLVVPVAAGAVLLGPAAASGFYELARRQELGLDSGWRHFLDAQRGPTADAMMTLTAMLALLFLLWIMAAAGITIATIGISPFASASAFVHAVLATRAGWEMMIVGNLVGLGFAILALAMAVVSFPMLVDGPVGVRTALRTSLRVTIKNPVTIATWGLIVTALLVLGAIPALVGLGVVLPVLGYATWHLYTRAVIRPIDQ
jgi:uncharacterized membrane protein